MRELATPAAREAAHSRDCFWPAEPMPPPTRLSAASRRD